MVSFRPITDLFTHPQNVKLLSARLMVAVLMLATVVQSARRVLPVHPSEENSAPPLALSAAHLGGEREKEAEEGRGGSGGVPKPSGKGGKGNGGEGY